LRVKIIKAFLVVFMIFSGGLAFAQAAPSHEQLKKMRTGTFEYLTGLEKGDMMKRTRNKQYEYDPAIKDKQVAVLQVKWLSDDEYWLILIKDDRPTAHPPKGFTIKIKILTVTGDSYTFHWDCDDCKGGGTGSFRKIK
jgi:hypothetical protein